MQASNIIGHRSLGGGHQVTITDETSHYFGGYYHVRIRVSADLALTPQAFADQDQYRDALRRLGASVLFCRDLEKMAVPEAELETVRRQLLESFEANVLPYLRRDGFADSFVQSEYRKSLQQKSAQYR